MKVARKPARHEFKTATVAGSSSTGGSLFVEKAIDPFLAFMTQVADPDEVLRKAGVSRPMLRALTGDDEITTAMDTRREALLTVPWRLELLGRGEDARDALPEPVKWLWAELDKVVERVLRSCMEALAYGYSVQEAVYQTSIERGRITFAQITEKPFEWFIPQRDGTTVLYKSMTNPTGEPVDPRKFFLTVRNQTYRQPYGDALFSRLYWPWLFRSNGWKFWVKFLERFGTPLLVGKTTGDATVMALALSKAVQDAAVAVGVGDDVQAVAQATGGTHFQQFEMAVCGRIQKLVLGQTLTTDAGGSSGASGSYALGTIHNEVRKDRRDADVRMVTPVMQRIVNTLWTLNAFAGDPPVFVMADERGLESERATRDAELANAGIVNFTAEYLIRTYDFEPEDIQIPDHTQPGSTTGPNGMDRAAAAEDYAAGRRGPRFTAGQEVVEQRLAEVLRQAPAAPIDDELIAEAIRAAASPQDLVNRLATLLAEMPRGEFTRVLERAVFAADLLGYAHTDARTT